jgi:membrane protein YdbS with pleckstrin-like domain
MSARRRRHAPAWDGIAGWVLMLVAAVLALAVIPYPHNRYALITVALAIAGGALVASSVTRQGRSRR